MAKGYVNEIIAYETGNLSNNGIIRLFSKLIRNGQAWTLQGHYGRMATTLIEAGFIDKKGNINKSKIKDVV